MPWALRQASRATIVMFSGRIAARLKKKKKKT